MSRKNRQNTASNSEKQEPEDRETEGGASQGLSHIEEGPLGSRSRMVDITEKAPTTRSALARARMRFPEGTLEAILAGDGPKGAIEEIARAASFLAAKKTAELVPMCHPLAVDHLELELSSPEADLLELRFLARTQGATGVEMEAMVGASIAALTVYDMTKALDKGITLEAIELLEKSGGKSGLWRHPGLH